jgi:hypothetical protein
MAAAAGGFHGWCSWQGDGPPIDHRIQAIDLAWCYLVKRKMPLGASAGRRESTPFDRDSPARDGQIRSGCMQHPATCPVALTGELAAGAKAFGRTPGDVSIERGGVKGSGAAMSV